MTPKERAVMQQALEVLRLAKNSHGIMLMSDPPKDAWRFHDVDLKLVVAITALREALAEPDMNLSCKSVQARLATSWGYVKAEQAEQEPVAWSTQDIYKDGVFVKRQIKASPDSPWVDYADPVRTKDLTDDEICKANKTEIPDCQDLVDFARAVIQEFRRKNGIV